jgi:aminopeptidase N
MQDRHTVWRLRIMHQNTSAIRCLFLFILLVLPVGLRAQPLIRHDMQVVLQPPEHRLQVTDTITFPSNLAGPWQFLLHAGLRPTTPTPGVHVARQQTEKPTTPASLPLESYAVTLPPGMRSFVVQYAGEIMHPLQQQGPEYARGFRDTPGTIAADGVYLSAATYWYPRSDNELLTFTLEVRLPPAWDAVSQGQRTRHQPRQDATQVRWESTQPQEEIYLVGGKYTEYSQSAGRVQAMAFLRQPDAQLAQKYLEATAQYIAMYSDLIGPYPYGKFALVENFWETGYGMPSFTLLGPSIIRFPFILHSSYPHEILHNWWGNGVFIDATEGNWAEGLTAYLADHLIQEQRGTAVTYRRTTLQKYADYVAVHQDFPLMAFRARHDAVTEAVGYGKAMMLFHMLRQQIGDEAFVRALQAFYRDNRYRQASFDDLRRAFTNAVGSDMQEMFEQWITRTGAPELRIREATVRSDGAEYLLTTAVEQIQPGAVYRLQLPLAVTMEGREPAYQTTATMSDTRLALTLRLPARPLRLDVDPQFDVFRRLHRDEIPPALSQMFGAEKVMMILPAAATEAVRQGYGQLAQAWQQGTAGQLEVRWDDETTALPTDRAVWLCGWDNRWRSQLSAALTEYDAAISADVVRLGDTELRRATHTVVLATRHPSNPQLALAWIATDNPAALPGLARKLPHYGKYSYLGFTGDEPTNVAKGQWPVVQSPMSVFLPQADGRIVKVAQAELAPRHALATLPAVFSAKRMLQTIRTLASNEMRGRGFGTPELDRVADFLAAEFREAGLQPAGDQAGDYFQSWRARGGNPEREVRLKNVVGIIPGRKPEWADQSVVVGAHYDHLGLGWPDVHQADIGKVHPGADDNASGVAVLLELARVLGKTWRPDRTVVFVAFSGEEAGRLGSQYYVSHAQRFPVAQSIGMLNLDTVGRLGQNKLIILGTASAREWPHIFRGAGYMTGVEIEPVAAELDASDQKSFLDAGIPAVQLFSGVHRDYHRPTDTVDKIDPQGLVKVAAVARQAVVYLAGRDTPLTSTLGADHEAVAKHPETAPGRRVSLGTVPDFTYDGQGYRVSDVTPDSPAAKAGLQAGDIIVRLGHTAIPDIRALASVLKTLQPGDHIDVTFRRAGSEHTIQAQVVPR